jgi:hypothetical protein
MHTGHMVQIRVELTYIPKNYYFIKPKTQKDFVTVFYFLCFYICHQHSLNRPSIFTDFHIYKPEWGKLSSYLLPCGLTPYYTNVGRALATEPSSIREL